MSNYDFEVTIKRMLDKTSVGTRMVFNGTEDLDEIFTPKIVSMILKDWAKSLEERQAIIPCGHEEYMRKTYYER